MSQLARLLIEENKKTRTLHLDLGNCGLSKIPEEIGELVWLRTLSIAGRRSPNDGAMNDRVKRLTPLAGLINLEELYVSLTQVRNLRPLAALTRLHTLHIARTRVDDLTPLVSLTSLRTLDISDTRVSDLAPLANLTSLQALQVWGTQIADLGPLSALTRLETLHISRTQVAELAPLAALTGLHTLHLSRTNVTDLTPLAALTSLQVLGISATPVTELGPLSGLTSLQRLNLSNTQVTDLSPLLPLIASGAPVFWRANSWSGPGIYVEHCPLVNPPPDIVRQGNAAILNYFRERAIDAVDHLYEAKLLIVGEGGAGKTSLLRRLYQPELPLPAPQETTKGIAIHRHDFTLKNGRRFRLNVWDFGGQEIYHATHQFFLTSRSLYLLLDDALRDDKSVSDPGFRYWLNAIDVFGGRSPMLIFQNNKGNRTKAIDLAGIMGQYENVKGCYAGNLEYPDATERVREAIEFYASTLSHIGEELPARWIQVRADIERRASDVPFIPQHEYFAIYEHHLPFDRTRALHLSQYLHDLGVFLHFQDHQLLSRTVILRNSWATEAVFRILDDEVVKARHGRFGRADCERLWTDPVFADMHLELLALMERFELCYPLTDSRPTNWLAPQLLPPARPTELTKDGAAEALVLRYRYSFLPKGLVSRLTVRQHRFVRNPGLAWVTGVVFERDTTLVLVEVLPDGSEVELRATGPERLALLSVVAAEVDALNDSFQGLRDKVAKRIPCSCRACRAARAPHFFDHKEMLRRKEKQRLTVECPVSFADVDVLKLLDGVSTGALPSWAGNAQRPATRVVRIFLASSAELRDDRDAVDLHFRQLTDRLRRNGVYLEIVRWETFFGAMSETRTQDEYNKAVRSCDIFLSLFFTKAGAFTEAEFDVALSAFVTSRKPRIYTFLKNAAVRTGDLGDEFASLLAFRKRLTSLGHFWNSYSDIHDLKLQLREQLEQYLDQLGDRGQAVDMA